MGVFKVLLYITWFQIAFATLKYQGFKKTKIAEFEDLKTTQNATTLIECCGFCMATPTCQGVFYEKDKRTCKAIKIIRLDENGPYVPWAIENLKVQDEDDCFRVNWDYAGANLPGSGSRVGGPKECQDKCQEHKDCEYFGFSPKTNKCYLRDKSVYVNGKWHGWGINGPKYCPVVLDTDDFCFQKEVGISGCDVTGTSGTVESGPEACQKRCQGVSGCQFWVFYDDSSKCYLKKEFKCAKYSKTGIAGPKHCN